MWEGSLKTDSNSTASPGQMMYDHVLGFAIQQLLYAVAELNIAEMINAGETSVSVLAEKTNTDANVLYRILRALASRDIFVETDDRYFEMTPQAAYLCADAVGSVRPILMLLGAGWHLETWARLDYSLATAEASFCEAHGEPLFDYLQKNADHSAVYSNAMTSRTDSLAQKFAEAYDFSQFDVLMDVGGGHGMLLSTILQSHENLNGILFDLPGISQANPKVLADSGVAKRCTIEEGSFFEAVPSGADAIIMKSIIHDWSDEKSREILRICHKALAPSAKLILCEFIVPGKNLPGLSKIMDIEMLVMSGGAERTEDEFSTLLASAGFTLQQVVPTGTAYNLIVCSAD